jgi:hypothetical protein
VLQKEAKRIPIRFALSVPGASQRVGSLQNQEKNVMYMYICTSTSIQQLMLLLNKKRKKKKEKKSNCRKIKVNLFRFFSTLSATGVVTLPYYVHNFSRVTGTSM